VAIRHYVLALAAFGLVAACVNAKDPSSLSTDSNDATILALGDSIFEYNSIQSDSIPDVVGKLLGTAVANAARAGAHFSRPDSLSSGEGLDIRDQFVAGGWDWVLLEGGGNDYLGDCGCGDCGPYIDELVSADGLTGEIPDFVRGLVSGDTQVMIMGYYDVPSDAQFGFDQCGNEVQEHNRRLALLAAATESVWFVSAGDVVSVDDRTAYAEDRVHPSKMGSRAIGEYIAAEIMRIDGS
jgi:GDSL-like Lipase/Acylhydrolase family